MRRVPIVPVRTPRQQLHLLTPLPLDSGIEELREKREEVNRSIAKDEEEKGA